jgi:hypothetical protein
MHAMESQQNAMHVAGGQGEGAGKERPPANAGAGTKLIGLSLLIGGPSCDHDVEYARQGTQGTLPSSFPPLTVYRRPGSA